MWQTRLKCKWIQKWFLQVLGLLLKSWRHLASNRRRNFSSLYMWGYVEQTLVSRMFDHLLSRVCGHLVSRVCGHLLYRVCGHLLSRVCGHLLSMAFRQILLVTGWTAQPQRLQLPIWDSVAVWLLFFLLDSWELSLRRPPPGRTSGTGSMWPTMEKIIIFITATFTSFTNSTWLDQISRLLQTTQVPQHSTSQGAQLEAGLQSQSPSV